MKNETRFKIEESRQKYFQEIRKQKTEKSSAPENRTGNNRPVAKKPDPAKKPVQKPGVQLEFEFGQFFSNMLNNIPSINFAAIVNRNQVGQALDLAVRPIRCISHPVTATAKRVTAAVNQRSERAIERFSSYMMVLFDA